MTTVALVGGGTAGHITPLIAVAEQISERARMVVLGTRGGRESELLPEAIPIIYKLPKLPFPRRLTPRALLFPFRFFAAVWGARRALRQSGATVLVGFGGYTAAAAYLAAWSLRLGLVVHEANALPGLANRLGAKLTSRVGVCFPGTPLRGAIVVGMPLRANILSLSGRESKTVARAHFGLRPRTPVLLITGGSSGARDINQTAEAVMADLLGAGWQVLHLRGPGHEPPKEVPIGWVSVDYTDRMDLALQAAELVVSRAGAATVSELALAGKPAIFVPYHVGNGEQEQNARSAREAGAALLVRNNEFTAEWVRANLVPLLGDKDRLARMAQAMASLARAEGASTIARWALEEARVRGES